MTWFIPTLPLWVSILFLLVIPLPILLIANLMGKGASQAYAPALGKRVRVFVGLGYALFLGYATYGWSQGWYAEPGLPPRILLYTTIPLLLTLLLAVFPWPYYRRLADALPTSEWVRLHRFRFVGSFFLLLFFFGELPPTIGIIAGCGDILTAASSFWVAKQLAKQAPKARTWALAWNTFGLLDIIATSAMASILTQRAMTTGAQGVEALASFPFCFIPAFAPATIIFLHLTIYRRLRTS